MGRRGHIRGIRSAALAACAAFLLALPTVLRAESPATSRTDERRIRVLTANIRVPAESDGVNDWPARKTILVSVLRTHSPDILGLQEAAPGPLVYLKKELPEWADTSDQEAATSGSLMSVGGMLGRFNRIFYRQDRFTVLSAERSMLRPDAPQEPATENAYYTLAVLRDRKDPRVEILVLDTHLRHRKENATVCAQRIHEKLRAAWDRHPAALAVVMGDINHTRTSEPYAALLAEPKDRPEQRLVDTFDYAAKAKGERWETWHNFQGPACRMTAEWPSDLILVSPGWRYSPATLVRDTGEAGRFPSDHYFVETVLTPGGK